MASSSHRLRNLRKHLSKLASTTSSRRRPKKSKRIWSRASLICWKSGAASSINFKRSLIASEARQRTCRSGQVSKDCSSSAALASWPLPRISVTNNCSNRTKTAKSRKLSTLSSQISTRRRKAPERKKSYANFSRCLAERKMTLLSTLWLSTTPSRLKSAHSSSATQTSIRIRT